MDQSMLSMWKTTALFRQIYQACGFALNIRMWMCFEHEIRALALLSISGCPSAKYCIPGAMTHSGCNTGYACIQVYQLEANLLKEIHELRKRDSWTKRY